mgnify:CR=1 FL=1
MKILVIDGQGGRMGSLFIEKWRQLQGKSDKVIAVGSNSIATAQMIKAGADAGATGENPVIVQSRDADVIVGPIGIMAADALLGEITEAMASAVARSSALKILIPVNTCSFHVMGVGKYTMSELITEAVNHIKEAFEEK